MDIKQAFRIKLLRFFESFNLFLETSLERDAKRKNN